MRFERLRGPLVAAAVTVAAAGPAAAGAVAEPLHPVTAVVLAPGLIPAGTVSEVESQVAGVSQYWRDLSAGAVDFRLDGSVVQAPTLGACDDDTATAYDKAATASGFQPGPQKHLVAVLVGCDGPAGVGTVGSGITSGGRVYLKDADWKGFWAHELGHNIGFGHASLLLCPDGLVDGELDEDGGPCRRGVYNDPFDTMGTSPRTIYKGLSTPSAIRVGILGVADRVVLDGSSDADEEIVVQSRDLFAGVRSVQVTDPRTGRTYWIEVSSDDNYSAGIVGDAGATREYDGVTYRRRHGVRVLRADGNGTLLLAAPPADGERSMNWPAGSTFAPASGGVEVTVVATTDTSATLRVRTRATPDPAPPAAPDPPVAPTAAPATTPAPTAPSSPAPTAPAPVYPAKLEVARAGIDRGERRLSVLAPITARAAGTVRGSFRAAGRTTRFAAPVDAARRRVRIATPVSAAQARLGTGILTLSYPGDADTQPQTVRLRAASRKALLRAGRPRLDGDRLRAAGTISDRARGRVRLQLLYEPPDGPTRTLSFSARITAGRYALDVRLPADVVREIAARRGVLHSYTLFTGYLPARMRGEMESFQVLGGR